MSPRPQIDHIRRPQILEAATRVIAERGAASTRIADIAEEAGTSAPAVLYWFDSKDDLLAEALGFAEDDFYEALHEQLDRLETAAERLRLLIESSVADYDWTLWMELWTRALRDEDAASKRFEQDQRWRRELEREIEAGRREGEFAGEVDAERAATILSALLDGLAVQVTLDDPTVDRDRMRELAVEVAERLLETELPEVDPEIVEAGSKSLLSRGGDR